MQYFFESLSLFNEWFIQHKLLSYFKAYQNTLDGDVQALFFFPKLKDL